MASVVKNSDGTYTISAYGKTYTTNHYTRLSNDMYDSLVAQLNAVPAQEDVIYDFNSVASGQSLYSNIKKKYVFDLRCAVLNYKCRWTISEVFSDIDLLSILYDCVLCCPNTQSGDLFTDIFTRIRTAGKPVCNLPSHFPIQSADVIIQKYNKNNNWYDFSCGWGDRLLCALRNNVNYFGTDPNYLLTQRLQEMSDDYARYTLKKKSEVQINTCGSEIFIPKYFNSMGLAFSSPPYFILEDYKVGNQSYTDGVSYDMWLSGYMTETMKNIYDYLIVGGYFVINVRSFDKYDLELDCRRIAEQVGFTYVTTETLKNIDVKMANGEKRPNDEGMFVFTKEASRIQYHDSVPEAETVLGLGKTITRVKPNRFF